MFQTKPGATIPVHHQEEVAEWIGSDNPSNSSKTYNFVRLSCLSAGPRTQQNPRTKILTSVTLASRARASVLGGANADSLFAASVFVSVAAAQKRFLKE